MDKCATWWTEITFFFRFSLDTNCSSSILFLFWLLFIRYDFDKKKFEKKFVIGKIRTRNLTIALVCPETVLAIGAHSSELGKTFALSLGDPKFCRLFKDSQLAAIRYVDFLFANKEVSHLYESYLPVRHQLGRTPVRVYRSIFFF